MFRKHWLKYQIFLKNNRKVVYMIRGITVPSDLRRRSEMDVRILKWSRNLLTELEEQKGRHHLLCSAIQTG